MTPYKNAITLVVLAGLAIAGVIHVLERNHDQAMDRLFWEAAGYPPYFEDSSQSFEAVRTLAKYHNQRSTGLLLQIAPGEGPLIAPAARDEAFKTLRAQGDPIVGVELAKSLQPHIGLRTREAIGATLVETTCDDECVRSILHYLERISGGELNEEDRAIFPPGTEDLHAQQTREEEALYENLRRTLQRHSDSTLRDLVNIYGLGSDNPSKFALDLISQMRLQQACPLLLQSGQLLDRRSPDVYRGATQDINTAIATINCR